MLKIITGLLLFSCIKNTQSVVIMKSDQGWGSWVIHVNRGSSDNVRDKNVIKMQYCAENCDDKVEADEDLALFR